MDYKKVGEEMLEALAIQGQIAGLEEELAQKDNQLRGLKADVEAVEQNKSDGLESQTLAIDRRDNAERDLAYAKSALDLAEREFDKARLDLESASLKVGDYGEDFFANLDNQVVELEERCQGIESERDLVQSKLQTAQDELKLKEGKLAQKGIKLSLGNTRKPKSIVL